MMNHLVVRPIRTDEQKLLEHFLYLAIHIPPGTEPVAWETIFIPEVYLYIANFGKPHDYCLVAEVDGNVVGAAWSRILSEQGKRGYGNIDGNTPELAVSVLPEYRNVGVGTMLVTALHKELIRLGYRQISLSVQKTNNAFHLYSRLGYEVINENQEDYIMLCNLIK